MRRFEILVPGRRPTLLPAVPLVLGLMMAAACPAQGQPAMIRSVFASAGGIATSPTHMLESTLGETVVGGASGGDITIESGFWGGEDSPSVIEADPSLPLPASFAMHRPAPNPFSGVTAIGFDVPPSGGRVDMRVFDVGGRSVRSLLSGSPPAGRFRATWDGRSDAGRLLDPGVYFVVFRAPGLRRDAKLVLLR